MAYHSLRGMPNQHARETSYDTYDAAEQEEEDQDPEANLEDAGAQAYTFDGDDNNNEESSTVHPEPELSSHSGEHMLIQSLYILNCLDSDHFFCRHTRRRSRFSRGSISFPRTRKEGRSA